MAKLSPEEKRRRIRKDIAVKLSKIFDDCVISINGYVFPYYTRTTEHVNTVLAILKPEWVPIICPQYSDDSLLESIPEFIHIKSMEGLKKAIDEGTEEPVEIIPKGSDEISLTAEYMDEYDKAYVRDPSIHWVPVSLTDEQKTVLFDDNMAIDFPGIQECEGHNVTIGKSEFPFTNKNTVNSVTMVAMKTLGRVYALMVQTDTPYFILYSKYIFI